MWILWCHDMVKGGMIYYLGFNQYTVDLDLPVSQFFNNECKSFSLYKVEYLTALFFLLSPLQNSNNEDTFQVKELYSSYCRVLFV